MSSTLHTLFAFCIDWGYDRHMNTTKWTLKALGGVPVNTIAKRAGIVGSTLQRQLDGDRVSGETVIAVARALNLNPVQALVDSGVLTPEDASRGKAQVALRAASDLELARELLRRAEASDTGFYDKPISEATQE